MTMFSPSAPISFNVNLSHNLVNKHFPNSIMSHEYIHIHTWKVVFFEMGVLLDRWRQWNRARKGEERLGRRKQGEGEKFSSLASSRTVTALHRNVPYCCMVCTVPNSSDRCHKVTEPSYVQTSVYSESPFPSFTWAFLFFLFPILLRFHWKTKSNNQRYNMNFSNQP